MLFLDQSILVHIALHTLHTQLHIQSLNGSTEDIPTVADCTPIKPET